MASQINGRAFAEDLDFDALLQEYRPFIASCVYRTLGKSVNDLDGAMRIASDAFAEAARSYTPREGKFLGFAGNAIYRRLNESMQELPSGQAAPFDDIKKIDPAYPDNEAVEQQIVDVDAFFRSEVEALSGKLGSAGITFQDVAESSPASSRKKRACAAVARTLYRYPELHERFRETGRIPEQELERMTGVDQRLIYRCRHYILFLAEILLGGHVHLAEFIKYGAEG